MRSGVVYAMTKAAMAQMSYNLACEWAKDNIRINTIAPWYIDTPLVQPVLKDPVALNQVLQVSSVLYLISSSTVYCIYYLNLYYFMYVYIFIYMYILCLFCALYLF